jgi:hypothetical protein
LDRERMLIAEERHSLCEDRVASSKSADRNRDLHLKLTEAVRQYVTQGIPIPFALQGVGMCEYESQRLDWC